MGSYAVIELGGKQYTVAAGDVIVSEKVAPSEDRKAVVDKVLLLSHEGKTQIGRPYLAGSKVELELLEAYRGKKIDVFKFKRRKGYKKKIGHRQSLMRWRVAKIAS